MDQYFGVYQAFETTSKNEGAALLSADNLVGDVYEVSIELEEDTHRAWLVNRFNHRVGFFDPSFSRNLSIYKARGFEIKALLSYVAYSDAPEPGRYWGEMAVICYNPTYQEAFSPFIDNISKKLSDGIRPRIDLGRDAIQKVIESNGSWVPDQTVSLPKKKKGTAILTDKRSAKDKMIEEGRKGNKGCYIVSWAFIIALIALVLFGLKSCGFF